MMAGVSHRLLPRPACLTAALCLLLPAAGIPARAAPPAGAERDLELRYAEGLTQLGLTDYAEMVLARLSEGPKAKVLKLQIYLAKGEFDRVKAVIAQEPDQDSEDTWAMRLSLGDAYYAWGQYAEARAVYESFFKRFPGTPPPNIAEFYVNSAHRFAQMLVYMGQPQAAMAAYQNALRGATEKHVQRQLLSEVAELTLKMADTAAPADKTNYLAQVDKICDELLWIQDIWFGKAIAMKAHLKLMKGELDAARAQAFIDEYKAQLVAIDESLKAAAEAEGRPELTRLSPMAEVRYLLGVILQDKAERLLAAGGDRGAAEEYLAGKEEKGKRSPGALQHFYNVFINYPTTPWAPDAGVRAQAVQKILTEKLGRTVKVDVPREKWAEVERAQFQSARSLFNQNQWEEAAESYLKILNFFPETDLAITSLGDLCRCFIEAGNELYAELVVRYLAERFGACEAFVGKAGDQMLAIADAYAERQMPEKAAAVRERYATHFKAHSRAAALSFRAAEEKFTAKDFQAALAMYQQIREAFPGSPLYDDALSRIAACQQELGDREAEIRTLSEYVKALEGRDYPGQSLITAKYRQAAAYRDLGEKHLPAAINRFTELVKLLSGDLAKYQKTAEEAKTNTAILEASLFQMALGLSRLPPPEGKPPTVYKSLAVQKYEELLTRFPKSEYAPPALSQIGTLWTILQKPGEAKKAFERLQKDHPEAPEAKNANFLLGKSLLDLGRRQEAVAVFKEMFSGPAGKFSVTQILTAGNELLKAGEREIAAEAFERVLASSQDRPLREPALAGKGKSLVALGRLEEGIQVLEALLAEYKNSGLTVEVCFALAQAYGALGEREADEIKRVQLFNGAMQAMKTARRYVAEDKAAQAGSELEVARISLRQSKASEQFAAPAAAAEQRNRAIATYQVLILRAEGAEPGVLRHIEDAYYECIPLLLETERWQDALDDCQQYLQTFKSGRYVPAVSTWLNRAKAALATRASAPPAAGGAP